MLMNEMPSTSVIVSVANQTYLRYFVTLHVTVLWHISCRRHILVLPIRRRMQFPDANCRMRSNVKLHTILQINGYTLNFYMLKFIIETDTYYV